MYDDLDFVRLLIFCDHYAKQFQKELSQKDLEVASYILTEYEYLFDLWHIEHYEDVVDYISLALIIGGITKLSCLTQAFI